MWFMKCWSYSAFSPLFEDYYFRCGKILVQFSDRMYLFSLQSEYMPVIDTIYFCVNLWEPQIIKTLKRNPNQFSTPGNPQGKQKQKLEDPSPLTKIVSVIYISKRKIWFTFPFCFKCVNDCQDNQNILSV